MKCRLKKFHNYQSRTPTLNEITNYPMEVEEIFIAIFKKWIVYFNVAK